ncbi:MAG TPA: inositol monophosphatase family protein [Anaerolineae bacterium]|nr:inositol monophosphatase family protein [Anaerolineae bacterium]
MLNLNEAFDFAVATAQEAGALLRDHYRSGVTVKYKGEIDLITEADRASEELILSRIRSAYPASAILSEESGASANASSAVWIVDPLDGTTNFAHGLPIFSVTLALVVDDAIEVGVTYDPIYHELYTARRGQGAYLNGERLHVSAVPTLDKALLVTGFPYDRRTNPHNNIRQFTDFSLCAQGVLRLGSAALDLGAVAAGRLDGYWEWRINPWDIAAGALMVTEAGGQVTMPDGSAFDLFARKIVASNGPIHEEMIGTLAKSLPWPEV